MIGIPVALAWTNAGEWLLHKYVLHGLGRRPGSFWAYHWEHHRAARLHGFRDPGYERSFLAWNPQGKEVLSLAALGVAYAPLLPLFPFFTATIWWRLHAYWAAHRRAHLDPAWGREHLPWHWDHHMGRDPNANWCVTNPFFDRLLGTRTAADGPVPAPAPGP